MAQKYRLFIDHGGTHEIVRNTKIQVFDYLAGLKCMDFEDGTTASNNYKIEVVEDLPDKWWLDDPLFHERMEKIFSERQASKRKKLEQDTAKAKRVREGRRKLYEELKREFEASKDVV